MTLKSATPPPLPAGPLLALMGVLVLVFLPFLLHLPWWLMGVVLALVGYRYQVLRQNWPMMPLLWMLLVLSLVVLGTYSEYGSVVGRDAGTAILLVLMGMKLNESRRSRDAYLLVLMGFFTLVALFFFQQDLVTTVYTLLVTVLLYGVAAQWKSQEGSLKRHILKRIPLLLRALPLTVVLFVVFPRPDGPLWSMPVQNERGNSGLADEIRPGSVSEVARNPAVAFRVEFLTPAPPVSQMYWRGPVYEYYDGLDWLQQRDWSGSFSYPQVESRGQVVRYRTTLEPHGRSWVLALDTVISGNPGVRISWNYQAVTRPVTLRRQFELQSIPQALLGLNEHPDRLRQALQLPAEGNPRARQLARSWATLPPAERVEQGLKVFRTGGFEYTLSPPVLEGENTIDDLLFSTRAGFCEHFAGAFTFLMRAAGVPARVVGGYLGGQLSPNGDYHIVRQSDAHAWVEVWLEGQGWYRVDPTAAVSPARLTGGLAAGLINNDLLPAIARGEWNWLTQLQWQLDHIQYLWNQWVIGYSQSQQQALLQRVGGVGVAVGVLLLAVGVTVYRRPRLQRRADPLGRTFEQFTRHFAVQPLPSEPASVYARRLADLYPDASGEILEIIEMYQDLKYGPQPAQQAVLAFQQRVRRFRLKGS